MEVDDLGHWPVDQVDLRRTEVVRLRRRGHIWEDIPRLIREKFGATPSIQVLFNDFKVTMARRVKEQHEEVDAARGLMLDRLDKLILGILDRAESGSLDHIEMLLKLEQRRSKLIGADAPVKSEIDDKRPAPPKLTEAQILDRMAVIQEKLRQRMENRGVQPVNQLTNGAQEGELVFPEEDVILPAQSLEPNQEIDPPKDASG